ncbi:MAG: AbrB/MazE/SpoVT family DNA-binding domain-containing protein [Alphaproteobacteria bacterium]|nr:AbrB/MazE/SpoVT family DNA-binding domain-containing protein [Alphaproteobacteria bacterium]
MAMAVPVSEDGYITLPPSVLKRLGLSGGGTLVLEETEHGVVLRAAAQVVAGAQALAKRHTGDRGGVTAFLAERARDSGC